MMMIKLTVQSTMLRYLSVCGKLRVATIKYHSMV